MSGSVPFRIGSSSYVYPDTLSANVEKLAGEVDDIEILLFEQPSRKTLPSPRQLRRMRRLARENRFSYTVHLPLSLLLGAADARERKRAIGICAQCIEALRVLSPVGYIVHANSRGESWGKVSWRSRIAASLQELASAAAIEPGLLALENLSYPFCVLDRVIEETSVSCCADLGHLLVRGASVRRHLLRYRERIRVVHLHGVSAGKDHRSLSLLRPGILEGWVRLLREIGYGGVVTLEVFSKKDFGESREALKESVRAVWAN